MIRSEDVELIGMSQDELDAIVARETAELTGGRSSTGASARPCPWRAHCHRRRRRNRHRWNRRRRWTRPASARRRPGDPRGPGRSPGTEVRLATEFDEVVCLEQPHGFFGIGQFYVDFGQLHDQQVIDLLAAAHEPALAAAATPATGGDPPPLKLAAEIEAEPGLLLNGDLWVPEEASGPGDLRPRKRVQQAQSPEPRGRGIAE